MTERQSIKVLQECIDLQQRKSNDYQNPNSKINQADYYPSGCLTIHEIMHAKMLRMRSVMEAMINDPDYKQNFESLEDSAKDLINYASFFVAFARGKIPGQDTSRDFLNRKIKSAVNDQITDSVTQRPRPQDNAFYLSGAPGFGVDLISKPGNL
jgi:hypothetical protein